METIWKQKRAEASSATARFYLILLAEKERFELSVLSYTRVPGVHLKPLGHLSVIWLIHGAVVRNATNVEPFLA